MLGAGGQPNLILVVEQDFSIISLLMTVYSYEICSYTTISQKCPSPQRSPTKPLLDSPDQQRGASQALGAV